MVTFERAERERLSEECRCGSSKVRGDAFCRSCWFDLPVSYRLILPAFCGRTRARIGRERKRLIYWRCLVKLGLTVKTAEQIQSDAEVSCLQNSV